MATTHTLGSNRFDEIQCCTCGVIFLIPTIMNQNAWNKRAAPGHQFTHGFFCPNGHVLGYNKTQEDLKEKTQTAGGNIIKFLTRKKHDDTLLDPRPAS